MWTRCESAFPFRSKACRSKAWQSYSGCPLTCSVASPPVRAALGFLSRIRTQPDRADGRSVSVQSSGFCPDGMPGSPGGGLHRLPLLANRGPPKGERRLRLPTDPLGVFNTGDVAQRLEPWGISPLQPVTPRDKPPGINPPVIKDAPHHLASRCDLAGSSTGFASNRWRSNDCVCPYVAGQALRCRAGRAGPSLLRVTPSPASGPLWSGPLWSGPL